MHSLPMIAVRSVGASSQWYAGLLRCTVENVAEDFARLTSDGRVLLLLHAWDAEEHGAWEGVPGVHVGSGFVLWFVVDDFDGVCARARELEAEILVEPHENLEDGVREFTLRDRDGYTLAIIEESAR